MGSSTRVTQETEGRQQAHVFVLRVWRVERAGRAELRGAVRDVSSGALRPFSDWSVMQEFVVEQIEERERGSFAPAEGGV